MDHSISHLLWLYEQFRPSAMISLEDLSHRWENALFNDDHKPLPRSTFNKYRNDVENIFHVSIKCYKPTNEYYMEGKSSLNAEKAEMLNSLYVIDTIQNSNKLRDRIVLENIPKGTDYMTIVLDAIRNNLQLDVTYKCMYADNPVSGRLKTYCLKVFKQRWYIIGVASWDEDQLIQCYSLDRILDIKLSNEPFTLPEDFNSKDYFAHSYGVLVEPWDYDVEKIQVKVYDTSHKREYIRLLPLHSGQKEIETGPDYSIFEYEVYPSYDFLQELFSHKYELEVISPKWVRDEMRKAIDRMYELYHKDDK